jgi:hypothetical protein
MRLFNAIGMELPAPVMEETVNRIRISVSELPPGNYWLNIRRGNNYAQIAIQKN